MPGETAHVQLIDDCPRRMVPKRSISFPVIGGRVHDHAFHRCCAGVAGSARGHTAIAIGDGDAPTVRVEQELRRIEPHRVAGIERARDAIAIQLARHHAGNKDVPVVIRAVGGGIDIDDACSL